MVRTLTLTIFAVLAAFVVLTGSPGEAAAQCNNNGKCKGAETCSSCPTDCGACAPVCGNGSCETGETCGNCAADCGACAFCGDGSCNGTESCVSCSGDCGACASCGDGTCDALEDCSSCPGDCGACATCGDGSCDGGAGEDCSTCSADCGPCGSCGDGSCDGGAGEDCSTCPADCGACVTCGDGSCDGGAGEDCTTCSADCGLCATCGNGTCDPTENCSSCEADCGACQNDFASCPFDLPECTGDINDCCYRDFQENGSDLPVIIALDRCHQSLKGSTKYGIPSSIGNAFCSDPDPSGSWDMGMVRSYGLIYRLMQNDINVYWLVNPTKDPPALDLGENANSQTYTDRDIDLWVLSNTSGGPPNLGGSLTTCSGACNPPVLRIDTNTMNAIPGSYSKEEIPFRGGAFVIAADDRARFNQFMTRTGEFSGFSGNSLYDFTEVSMYEIQTDAQVVYQDFRTSGPTYTIFNSGNSAPVAATIDYDPPRLARQSPANVSSLWLSDAQLDEPAAYPDCLTGDFTPSTAVYCDVTDADIQAGYLVTGDFDWAWIDNWGGSCADVSGATQMSQFEDFLTAVPGVKDGKSIMFMGKSVTAAEACTGREPLGATGGLTPSGTAVAEPLIIRYPANLFSQWGDVPSNFASGSSASSWDYSSNGYQSLSSLVRLVSQDTSGGGNTLCSNHVSDTSCDIYDQASGDTTDVLAYARYRDVDANGIVFYMGGRNVQQNGNTAHLRALLNAFIALPIGNVISTPTSETIFEITRSSPVVSTVDSIEAIYQGAVSVVQPPRTVMTYDGADDDATFSFPHFDGSMNAVALADLADESTSFDDLPKVFDAASGIPPVTPSGCGTPYTSSCRTVFTTTTNGDNTDPSNRPTQVFFNQSNKEKLAALLSSGRDSDFTDDELDVLISRVLAGRDPDGDGTYEADLGGVDRSTVAVIGSSPIAGDAERPTMAYFGGLDGMIHAVCADVFGNCTAKGQELWAYIPRTQLPRLKNNTQRIDGSPTVIDAFGDFDADGSSEWRTVMTIQLGSGDAGFENKAPAVIAIDITDPEDPVVLWEKVSNSPRTSFEMGIGLNTVMGPTIINNNVRYMTYAQTNNGGTGGSGFLVRAIDTVTGEDLWQFQQAYDTPRDASNPSVPATGYPSGVSAIDETKSASTITHLFAPSLYGEIFMIDAKTGDNEHTGPMFSFTEDFRPIGAQPTVFADQNTGKTMVLAVSGGYADPVATTWSLDSTEQFAVAFPADTSAASLPLDETTVEAAGGFAISLGVGNRAFASATVAGNELLIITDNTDINDGQFGLGGSTGSLARYSVSEADGPKLIEDGIEVAGGAGSAESSGSVVLSGSGGGLQKLELTDFDGSGQAVELTAGLNNTTRLVWLRLN